MLAEETSLTNQLAAALPRQLAWDRTTFLVRQALERARDEQLPLTPGVIAELVAATLAE